MTMQREQGQGRNLVEIAGDQLHCEWLGPDSDRAPLVFLHEGLGSVELWRDFPATVTAGSGHPGLVFSRVGHGWSEPITGSRDHGFMHYEALKVLPEVIESLVGRRPVLIGHSDGASIALIHAGSGFQVEGLVLIAPHVFVEAAGVARIGVARESYTTSDMPARMGKYHREPDRTFYGWADVWLSPDFRDWNLEEFLPNISCPTLLVQSTNDEYGSLQQLDAIETGLPFGAERLEVPGTSHSPHLSEKDLVTTATIDFIRSLEPQ